MWRCVQESLAPTTETLEHVCSNPSLLAAFDDPQIMAAVAEIARDPTAFNKYKSNSRVRPTGLCQYSHHAHLAICQYKRFLLIIVRPSQSVGGSHDHRLLNILVPDYRGGADFAPCSV